MKININEDQYIIYIYIINEYKYHSAYFSYF